MNESDLRIVKTRRAIEDALIRLLGCKSFEKITVGDILSEALINRTTFYRHYTDKYALAEHLCAVWLSAFQAAVDSRFQAGDHQTAAASIEQFYQIFSEHRETLLRLFTIRTETIHLYDDIAACLKSRFQAAYHNAISDTIRLDYLSELYSSLVLTSVKWCLEHEGYQGLLPLFPIFQSCLTTLLNDIQ